MFYDWILYCHRNWTYVQNFRSLASQEDSWKLITKYDPDRQVKLNKSDEKRVEEPKYFYSHKKFL